MAWDIYGNNLREGFCEVHPHVNEYYPCWICCDEIKKEEYRQREYDLQKADYDKAMEHEYYKAMEGQHTAQLQADKEDLLEALGGIKPALRYFPEKLEQIESLIQKHKQ